MTTRQTEAAKYGEFNPAEFWPIEIKDEIGLRGRIIDTGYDAVGGRFQLWVTQDGVGEYHRWSADTRRELFLKFSAN